MADVILSHQGTIDEFVGDAILAIFGAPLARQRRRAPGGRLRRRDAGGDRRSSTGGTRPRACPRLEMGIAVHTGEVIVGNIGSERRTKYGVVGSAVNHAGRIESFTVGGQILISEATLREAGDGVRVGARLAVDAKGTREPIVVYDLRGFGEARVPGRARGGGRRCAEPLNVLCHVVVGKRVAGRGLRRRGSSSCRCAAARCSTPRRLRPLSNLKIEMRPPGRPAARDLREGRARLARRDGGGALHVAAGRRRGLGARAGRGGAEPPGLARAQPRARRRGAGGP